MSDSASFQTAAGVPEPVVTYAQLMAAFPGTWALCGGWAIDAWLGRQTRDHADVDITLFDGDQRVLFEHLPGWELVAHDPHLAGDASERWDGRYIAPPLHIHARPETGEGLPDRIPAPSEQGFRVEFQVNERSGDDWVLSREPRLSLPVRQGIRRSPWGMPAVVPEVLLFYKALDLRERDKADFAILLPHLDPDERGWLRKAISLAGHPWLAPLAA